MTQPQPLDLDQIDTVIAAATPGPWGVYEYGGDSLIEIAADLEDTGCGYRARRTVCRFDEEPLDNDPTHREWTAEEDWAQVQADAAFIAAMSPETVKAMAAEIRRLRDQLATARTTALLEGAAAIDHLRATMLAPPVADLYATGLSGAAGELRRLAATPSEETHVVADDSSDPEHVDDCPGCDTPDTLPAWLRQRFMSSGVDWENLDDTERSYWEHQARAVRRAVARGGFKTDTAAVSDAARP